MIQGFQRGLIYAAAILGACVFAREATAGEMRVQVEKPTGGVVILDGQVAVLRYNYRTVEPPEGYLDEIKAGSRKYARARSNYIHPLYGPDGEELTLDWDEAGHPHHRGIYWAWPEVDYRGERGDLHALQRVFARPTGNIELRQGEGFAEIEAENEWRWEDKTPIVRETVTIRAHQAGEHGRYIDLQFEFVSLSDDVSIARRGTKAYGGLNIRLAPVAGLKLSHHADPPESQPRQAWQYATGAWAETDTPTTFVVLEHADNPDYPGDYVPYPNLPWFQPTFPRANTRYTISTDKPLMLRYRLLIVDGSPPEADALRKQWNEYNASAPSNTPSSKELSP
jgi:hypothetical protein